MPRTFFAAAMMMVTTEAKQTKALRSGRDGNKIVYRPDVDIDEYRVDPSMYPMAFMWPEGDFRCGATMISETMALTAAHCIDGEEARDPGNMNVVLHDGERYGIKEFRANDCWDFRSYHPFSTDIAIMVLDRPIENAVRGRDYVDIWNTDKMGDVVGKEFILAGWGAS